MDEKKFYDIHCHAMNMSHPNLLTFLKRININLLLMSTSFIGPLVALFGKIKVERIINLLALMENDIADFFLIAEFYLKKMEFVQNNSFEIGGITYNKIVLTPLIMDFGDKGTRSGTFYNLPPQKPIVEQVSELFTGIKCYTEYELLDTQGGPTYKDADKGNKLFEIYPFLGINTQNYYMEQKPNETSLPDLLDKYFAEDSRESLPTRQKNLFANMGTFDGDIDNLRGHSFAGIKVYPPLGFEPWPEDKPRELEKVKHLYNYCQEKCIPITTHCSDGGFLAEKVSPENSSPEKWRSIIEQYPKLKINFAHLGNQGKTLGLFPKTKWRDTILEFIANHDNVYTDFSYRGCDMDYYDDLRKFIDKNSNKEKVLKRILFGSDFMINLMEIDSYNEYLKNFKDTLAVNYNEKFAFCAENPKRFLFGED